MRLSIACVVVIGLIACSSSEEPPAKPRGVIREVRLNTDTLDLGINERQHLTAIAVCDTGTLANPQVTWVSRNASTASVNEFGYVQGLAVGTTWIVAQAKDVADSALVLVRRVSMSSSWPGALLPGDSLRLAAELLSPVPDTTTRRLRWISNSPGVFRVDSTGLVTALNAGADGYVVASIDDHWRDSMRFTVAAYRYVYPATSRMTPGMTHTFEMRQFYWKTGGGGTITSGVTWRSLDPGIARVDASGRVTAVAPGIAAIVAELPPAYDTARINVRSVPTGLRFKDVSGPCALDADGHAWCWGQTIWTRIPSGTLLEPADSILDTWTRMDPNRGPGNTIYNYWLREFMAAAIPLANGADAYQRFTAAGSGWALQDDGRLVQLSLGYAKPFSTSLRFKDASGACAVATDDRGYCWGNNQYGQRGVGTTDFSSDSVPQLTAGDLRWSLIRTAGNVACGLTTVGEAYCWGDNEAFRLGIGGDTTKKIGAPSAVRTSARFVTLGNAYFNTCGVTTTGSVLCWGRKPPGITDADAGVPYVVANAPRIAWFVQSFDVLAVDADGWVYILTRNDNATSPADLYAFQLYGVPFPVTKFSPGGAQTCAISRADGYLYCWGYGYAGQLGNGDLTYQVPVSSPVRVYGQQP